MLRKMEKEQLLFDFNSNKGTKENPIITVTKTPKNIKRTKIDLSIGELIFIGDTQKFIVWFEENEDSIKCELYVHWNYGDYVNSYCISKKRT